MEFEQADAYIDDHFEVFLEALETLVAQPSVSATGEGIDDCAALLKEMCLDYGFDTAEVVPTSGHPAVLARAYVDNDPDNNAPTVLMYGHYDVQPVEPAAWETPPFEPDRRETDGEQMLYGRGTVDNKGQHLAHVCAVKTLRETTGLPVNVTLLLDGEEESGSPNLRDAVEAREAHLAADVAISSDGPVAESGQPMVVLGNRGALVVELAVDGPAGDLHSGHYGGAVPNPAWDLISLLGTMKDDAGRVTIEGFYDDVRPITETDRELLADAEPDLDELLTALDVDGLQDGPGDTFAEKTLYYPTLNISGLRSGHTEDGFKTVVPADAAVTIDMRLVVDQAPDDIYEAFVDHVDRHASPRVSTTVSHLGSMKPTRTSPDTPYRNPVEAAVADGWGTDPLVKPSLGGSVPLALFVNYLDIPQLTVPYGQPDNNQHAPDEHFAIDNFERGIRTSVRLLAAVTEGKPTDSYAD